MINLFPFLTPRQNVVNFLSCICKKSCKKYEHDTITRGGIYTQTTLGCNIIHRRIDYKEIRFQPSTKGGFKSQPIKKKLSRGKVDTLYGKGKNVKF